jgi:glutaredoxin
MLVEIFVAPHGCADCGKAERLVRRVASDYPHLEVREVNVIDAADRLADFKVLTTPFIVIDGRLEFVGVPTEAALRARFGS